MLVARHFQLWIQCKILVAVELTLFCMKRTKDKTQGCSVQCVHGKQSHSGLSSIERSPLPLGNP